MRPRFSAEGTPRRSCCKDEVKRDVTFAKTKRDGRWPAQMLKNMIFISFCCFQMPLSLPWQFPPPRCLPHASHMCLQSTPDSFQIGFKCLPIPRCLSGASQKSQASSSRALSAASSTARHRFCKSIPTELQNT